MIELLESNDAVEGVFDRQLLIAGWKQETLRAATVMVVGAGAIGNEVLKNLALLGFGHVLVVDFDTIAPSNLSRTVLFRAEDVGRSKAVVAAERARELCLEPTAQVHAFHGDLVWELGTGVFRAMDLVLGCVDNVEARLAINRQCHLAGVPWIDAGIYGLAGHLAFFAPESACYRCGLSAQQLARGRQRYSCDDFKRRAVQVGEAPTAQVTSALVAALQVQEAAKHICGLPVATGVRLQFNGIPNDLVTVHLKHRAGCPGHARYPAPQEVELGRSATLRELLALLSQAGFAGPGAALDLRSERSFVLRARCRQCSRWIDLGKPRFAIFDTDAYCPDCTAGEIHDTAPEVPTEIEEISVFSLVETPGPVLDCTLEQIGIPLLGVLPVLGTNDEHLYYELTSDRSWLLPGPAPTRRGSCPDSQEESSDGRP